MDLESHLSPERVNEDKAKTMVNEIVRDELFGVIDKQIKKNDPPETKLTLERLMKVGYSEFQSKQLIAQCLILEIYKVFKLDQKHDEKRYIRNLQNLPREPE